MVAADLQSLLAAVGASSLNHLIETIDDNLEWDGFDLECVGDTLEIRFDNIADALIFPFTIDSFWATVHDLENACEVLHACDGVATDIADVEGFHVVVAPSPGATVWSHQIDSYPYEEPIARSVSVGEWRRERFSAHYPNLDVFSVDWSPLDDALIVANLRLDTSVD